MGKSRSAATGPGAGRKPKPKAPAKKKRKPPRDWIFDDGQGGLIRIGGTQRKTLEAAYKKLGNNARRHGIKGPRQMVERMIENARRGK